MNIFNDIKIFFKINKLSNIAVFNFIKGFEMNKILSIIMLISTVGFAQSKVQADTTLQTELVGALHFSQVYFDNWAAGGESTIAGQLDLDGKAIKTTDKFVWTNSGRIAYGTSKIADAEAKKTIDEIKLESVINYLTKYFADPYFSVRAETQLAPGYVYSDDEKVQVSDFLDPAYFTQSLGFLYKPNEAASLRIGVAVKETITNDYPAPYADDPDTKEIEKIKIEPGAEAVFAVSKNLSENTRINSTLDLFNNFTELSATDVKWDTDFTTKVTELINIKLSVKLFYDKDISLKRQLNQALMLGISYMF